VQLQPDNLSAVQPSSFFGTTKNGIHSVTFTATNSSSDTPHHQLTPCPNLPLPLPPIATQLALPPLRPVSRVMRWTLPTRAFRHTHQYDLLEIAV
jgi:hypothetical protein